MACKDMRRQGCCACAGLYDDKERAAADAPRALVDGMVLAGIIICSLRVGKMQQYALRAGLLLNWCSQRSQLEIQIPAIPACNRSDDMFRTR